MRSGTMLIVAAALFVGAFPGFVWGWFQVPDALFGAGWAHALQAYGDPLFAGAATALLFVALRGWLPRAKRPLLERAEGDSGGDEFGTSVSGAGDDHLLRLVVPPPAQPVSRLERPAGLRVRGVARRSTSGCAGAGRAA